MKLIATAALAVLLAFPAYAQQCIAQPKAEYQLTERFRESLQDSHEKDGVTYQVWANLQTGTWSFVGTAAGMTCMLAFGQQYDGQTVADFLAAALGEPA